MTGDNTRDNNRGNKSNNNSHNTRDENSQETPNTENVTAEKSIDTSTSNAVKKIEAAEKSDSETHTTTKDASASPSKISARKKWPLVAGFFFIVILGGLTFSVYLAHNLWNDFQAQQEERLEALERVASEQEQQLQQLANKQTQTLETQQDEWNNVKADQQAIKQRLDSHTQRLRALTGSSRDDWLLAEARYLLRLASQRLLVERGTSGAQALLESANTILLSMDEAGLLPVREAITNEIMALKLAKSVDRQGLYLELGAVQKQIRQLPLIPFRTDASEPTNIQQTTTESTTSPQDDLVWYQAIWQSVKQAFTGLGQFVKIRDHAQKTDWLISEQEQLNIVNQLTLLFEQAKFSLLHEEASIYRVSLEEAEQLLDQYYAHYEEYNTLRNETVRLKQQNIVQSLPNINRSTLLLTEYIERFHRLNDETIVEKKTEANRNTDETNTINPTNKE